MVRVAEPCVQRNEPLEVVADIELVGDADAAVQLHGLLADKACRPADEHLGRCNGAATFQRVGMLMERACSRRISMSAMRCCSAWKLPIGTPNCLRVFR